MKYYRRNTLSEEFEYVPYARAIDLFPHIPYLKFFMYKKDGHYIICEFNTGQYVSGSVVRSLAIKHAKREIGKRTEREMKRDIAKAVKEFGPAPHVKEEA